MLLRSRSVPGNQFDLLVDGEECAQAILAAIDAAEHYILVEHYLVEPGYFSAALFRALHRAAERGVQVRVVLDHFGSLGVIGLVRELLDHPGIQVVWFNPIQMIKWVANLRRDHRKFIQIDQQAAFVGGFCITDRFWPGPNSLQREEDNAASWLDVAVRIQGPVLIHWREQFCCIWQRIAGEPLVLPGLFMDRCGSMTGRAAWAEGHLHQGILREFLARARKAQERIYIATPYFAPSWRIRRMLMRAAQRGLDVRVLLPGPEMDHAGVRYAGWRYYKRLLRHGVRIYEFQPRFIHAKMIVCDDWCSIGSCNLDHWNQRWNLEGNQEIDDAGFARDVVALFQDCFELSEEQLLKDWLKPYWRRRWLAYFWGRVDAWLMRL